MADDELRITASLQDDISAALTRVEQRIKSLEDEVGRMGRAGAKGGAEFAAGMEAAGSAADDAGDQARQAKKPIKEVGDEAAKSGAKAQAGGVGLKQYSRDLDRAAKKAGGFRTILTAFKWAGIISGAFALAGGLSAIGAGGVIAIGGLAPMVGVVAGLLPLFAAAKLTMLAFKLAATQLEAPLNKIKTQFTELGPVIAAGGLRSGLDYFANSLGKLASLTGKGLAGLGGEIGATARSAGDLSKSAPFLDLVGRAFEGMRPIVRDVSQGLLAVAQVLLNVLVGALPMAQDAAAIFRQAAEWTQQWTAAQLANGNMTRWLNKSWEIFKRVIGVVVDILVGLFNVFKIGGQYAGEMGLGIEQAAASFRAWTGSAEGQARINQYFQDSLPALREMGKLLGMLAGGLTGLGANANVAPLLAQIRTELAPAISELIGKLSGQDGLGPAVITAATALVQLFAGLDFSALTGFVQGIAAVLQAIVWMTQNVPGANFAVAALLATMLGFKLLGPVFGVVSSGFKAFEWVHSAATGVGKLSMGQKAFMGVMRPLGSLLSSLGGVVMNVLIPALRMIAIAGVGALRTLSIALVTTPVGWIILAIMAVIGIIILLWTKCEWFRDAVKAVWEAIKTAAMAVWDAIKVAVSATIDFFVNAWNGAVSVFRSVIDWIVEAAQWIYTKAIKPVMDLVVGVFQVYWNIIKFVVQTVVYIIIAIISLIAVVAKAVWDAIAAAAQWVWNTVLLPIFNVLSAAWNVLWTGMKIVADALWTGITVAAQWFWNTILLPIITALQLAWNTVWNAMLFVAQLVWNGITAAAQWVWSLLQPIFSAIGTGGSVIWETIRAAAAIVWDAIRTGWDAVWGFLSGIWDKLKAAGSAVWDGIKSAAEAAAGVVRGVWDKVVGVIRGAWNAIANGWNSIPSITVPDWVPGLGGQNFSLPKLPTLWHGGEAPGGKALVGEHGPEPLVRGNQVIGMVGQNGPEVRDIPRGGYVVPNLNTLNALPGLAKSLPAGVARAVASSVPGYAGALGGSSGSGSSGDGASAALAHEVGRLASAVASQPPPVHVERGASDVYRQVLAAYRQIDRERQVTGKYNYSSGGG